MGIEVVVAVHAQVLQKPHPHKTAQTVHKVPQRTVRKNLHQAANHRCTARVDVGSNLYIVKVCAAVALTMQLR